MRNEIAPRIEIILAIVVLSTSFSHSCAFEANSDKGAYTGGGDEDAGVAAPLAVTFIDVGQGDSIILELPDGSVVLIDGGDDGAGDDFILPLLDDRRIDSIDLVILTHPHADHCGGLDEVLDEVPVTEIWENGEEADTYIYRRYQAAVEDSGASLYFPAVGYARSFGEVSLEVMHTDAGYDDLNNDSLVVMFRYGDTAFLSTGDVENEAQSELLPRYGSSLDCDLLKVPHHGSSYFDESFPVHASPEIAVISCGVGNDYGHPHDETLAAYESLGSLICRTDLHGTVVVSSDGREFIGGCD